MEPLKQLRPSIGNILTMITTIVAVTWTFGTWHKDLEIQSARTQAVEQSVVDLKKQQQTTDEQQDQNNVRFQERIYQQLNRVEDKVDKLTFMSSNTSNNRG